MKTGPWQGSGPVRLILDPTNLVTRNVLVARGSESDAAGTGRQLPAVAGIVGIVVGESSQLKPLSPTPVKEGGWHGRACP